MHDTSAVDQNCMVETDDIMDQNCNVSKLLWAETSNYQ